MSDPVRIAIVGATGLIGRAVIAESAGREDIHTLAVARGEMPLPKGCRMEMVVADPDGWGRVFERTQPDVLVSALGTTWNKAGKSEEAFRAVDQELVINTAKAAWQAGVKRIVAISSIGADPRSKNFYLRVKGEVEAELAKAGFDRIDILRPGLLRGKRDSDRRFGERVGIMVSPVTDLLMHGKYRKYRSIRDVEVAHAVLALAMRKAAGKFVHEHDAIKLAAGHLPQISGLGEGN